jgi:hypothetical protein
MTTVEITKRNTTCCRILGWAQSQMLATKPPPMQHSADHLRRIPVLQHHTAMGLHKQHIGKCRGEWHILLF